MASFLGFRLCHVSGRASLGPSGVSNFSESSQLLGQESWGQFGFMNCCCERPTLESSIIGLSRCQNVVASCFDGVFDSKMSKSMLLHVEEPLRKATASLV